LPQLSKEELLAVVEVEGLEHMEEQIAAKGGFVFVISHLGNWELFAQLVPHVYKCPVGTIYQALGNRFIDAEVRRDRSRLGLQLFERKEGFAGAAKFIREGGAVGVLIDQHAGDAGLWCPFFGRLASTTTLAEMLALRTGGWLIPAAVHSAGPARWRCVLRPRLPVEGGADQTTVRINQMLEEQIRVLPEDWFWVHDRWKTPRPKFLLTTYKRGVAGQPTKPFRMVIRSTNWLGDAVMTIPAVRAIKRGRPDAHVTILTLEKLTDLWRTVPEVDEVISIGRGEGVFAVAKKLRGKFDVAVLFPNSLRAGLEAWLAGVPRRVGYPGHRRSWLLNQQLREKKKKKKAPPARPKHQVHHYLALAEFIGADVEGAMTFPPQKERASLPIKLGVCPGAEYGGAKRWLPERFAEVMRAVREKTGGEWHLFGVAKDREIADSILRVARIECVDRVGKTSLRQLIDELRQCDLLLTNDTGTMHLAAALSVPVIAIFGSTEPELTGPLGEGHVVLQEKVECSPCFLRECPIDFPCMKAISAERVVEAVITKLAESRRPAPKDLP
jgi:lipopolysaccharide heptosyltransferase II